MRMKVHLSVRVSGGRADTLDHSLGNLTTVLWVATPGLQTRRRLPSFTQVRFWSSGTHERSGLVSPGIDKIGKKCPELLKVLIEPSCGYIITVNMSTMAMIILKLMVMG